MFYEISVMQMVLIDRSKVVCGQTTSSGLMGKVHSSGACYLNRLIKSVTGLSPDLIFCLTLWFPGGRPSVSATLGFCATPVSGHEEALAAKDLGDRYPIIKATCARFLNTGEMRR